MWVKVLKNRPSKICGRQALKIWSVMFYLGIETVIWCSLKTFVETETTQKGIVLPFFCIIYLFGNFYHIIIKNK